MRCLHDFADNWLYPFGGVKTYDKEHREKTAYLNQARITWVKKILEENER